MEKATKRSLARIKHSSQGYIVYREFWKLFAIRKCLISSIPCYIIFPPRTKSSEDKRAQPDHDTFLQTAQPQQQTQTVSSTPSSGPYFTAHSHPLSPLPDIAGGHSDIHQAV